MTELAEVQGNTLARRVRDVLLERILSGELPPGARLKDNEIAARFGISNTPVREALRLLGQQGVVEILPYHGCVVRRIEPDEVIEALQVRAELESFAARLAAPRLTAEHLAQLEALVERNEAALAAGDAAGADSAARAIHQLLVKASGNRMLAHGLSHLQVLIILALRANLYSPHPAEQSGYRGILEALRAGDGQQASVLLAEHTARSQVEIIQALRERSMPAGGA